MTKPSHNYQDLTGLTLGGLKVLHREGVDSGGHVRWRCRKPDGREVVRNGSYLARPRKYEPEKAAWAAMLARCENPNTIGYKDYGGRGIRVCSLWRRSYRAFLADMGRRPSPQHSLDRKDVEGHYEPRNCRWATLEEQARNTRTTRWVTFRGETLSLAGWSERLGIGYGTLRNRLVQGRPLEEVFQQGRLPQSQEQNRRAYTKHGMSGTPEYRAWQAMVSRCTKPWHPAWADYGGRGITVAPEWVESFEAFYNDLGPRPEGHSLERVDNELGYQPGNCRWSTLGEQANNTRKNRVLTCGGRTQTLAQWARELGMSSETIRSRLRRGWSVERALGRSVHRAGSECRLFSV